MELKPCVRAWVRNVLFSKS